jgi:hypothetical protein
MTREVVMKHPALRHLALLGVLVAAAACGRSRAAGDTAGATSGGSPADPAPPRELSVAPGASVRLESRSEITSRNNHAGDRIVATAADAVVAAGGDTVIPRGAAFYGRVTALAPAPHPDAQGVLRVTFFEVRIRDRIYPVHAQVTFLGTTMRGRGVTAGTAAKVGAGAVIGGVAGRLIGGNGTGTVVGAVAGGAGGAVVAHATRTMDIVLPGGAEIRLRLTEPFVRDIASSGEPASPHRRMPARQGPGAAERTPARA